MSDLMKCINEKGFSRRSFVQGSLIAGAALALSGCSSENDLVSTGDTAPVTEGEWKPVLCWAHCGGGCPLKAYVVDGMCIRLKTDDSPDDSPENPQIRACARGRARRQDVFGAQRLKYPMKRKSWQPGGGENAHGDLRGSDEWERISWDEALDLVAEEMLRIKNTYGNRAILGTGWHPSNANAMSAAPYVWNSSMKTKAEDGVYNGYSFCNVLNLFGGHVTTWSTMSYGSWYWSSQFYGYGPTGWNNDRMDAVNCEYAIVFGANPAVSACGNQLFMALYPMKEAGTKFYFIDPMYHDTCAAVGGEWIPIRPGTDKAMMLAMAYVMFSEDDPDTNPMIDWEFLDRCAIGFDADHMPEGTNPQDNFKDYVLGTYDGEPKTPEWAEPITGVPADKIVELGRIMAKDNKVAFATGSGPARGNDAEVVTQLHMIVGSLGGHIGKSGHMVGQAHPKQLFNEPKAAFKLGAWPLPELDNPVDDCLHQPFIWNALLEGKYQYNGIYSKQGNEERDIDIKCVYNYTLSATHHTINMPKAVEFYKTVDLAVCHSIRFDDNARMFDIVLPCITPWEKVPSISVEKEYCRVGMNISEPVFETKSDQWIGAELLKRWGIDPSLAYPIDEAGQRFALFDGAQMMQEDGSWKPLVSFTEEEAACFGSSGKPKSEGVMSFTELVEKGIVRIARKEGDALACFGGEAFVADPESNPLPSVSGKLEFYSAEASRATEHLYGQLDPLPKYVPTVNGYEATFSNYEAGTKGEYPLQVYNPHYYRSSHSHFDNLPWLREAFARPVFISSADAEERGIADGDTVRVWNNNGSVLRSACVTDRIIPGVVGLPHGGQIEIDEETGFNIGGSANWLTYPTTTGKGTCGYNTNICNVEKWSGSFEPDAQRPEPVPSCQLD